MSAVLVLCHSIASAGCQNGRNHWLTEQRASAVYLDTVPIRDFGLADGGPFFRVTSGLLLTDDVVVVGEQSSGTIRFYQRGNGLSLVVGGKGRGPGEFMRLSWMQALANRIYINDSELRRLSIFANDGSFVRSVRIEPPDPFVAASAGGVFSDGTILVHAYPPANDSRAEGVYRQLTVLLRYDEYGNFIDSLGSYEASETFRQPWGRMGQLQSALVFGRRSAVEVLGTNYYVLENNDYRIVSFDTSGSRTRYLSPPNGVDSAGRLVTETDIDIARQRFVKDATPQLDLAAVFERMPIPETFPPYGWAGERLLDVLGAFPSGGIWVLNYGGVWDTEPVWTVYRRDGRFKEFVAASEELKVLDTTAELALVLRWNDLDVESVEVRRIIRRSPDI